MSLIMQLNSMLFSPTQMLKQLLVKASSANHQERQTAQQMIRNAQTENLKLFLQCTFQIINSQQQNMRILGCSMLKRVIIQESRIPDINGLFYATFKALYGRHKEADFLLECLGLYLCKRQMRTHRTNFFDKTIPELIKNNDDLALMFMIRAVLKAIPFNSGFCQGNQLIFKIISSQKMIKNQSWVWAQTKICMARYCKYNIKWQILQRILMDHSNRKNVVLSVVKYIADFLDIVNTAQQCVYMFCFTKHMVDNQGPDHFKQQELQTIMYVWSKILNRISDLDKETNQLINFSQNFALFSQTMDILVRISAIYEGTSISLNNEIIKVIQAYSNIIDQERIANYTAKVNDPKTMDSFLLMLSGMPGRIIGLFGGDRILEGILELKAGIQNLSSLYFLRKMIESPMIPEQILTKILEHLKTVLFQCSSLVVKSFAFFIYTECIFNFPQLKQPLIIVDFFNIGMQLLLHKDIIDQSLDYALQGVTYLILSNISHQLIHQILINTIKGMIDSSVFKGPQLLFAKFKNSNIDTQKLIFLYRMLVKTYASHQQFSNAHSLLIHSALSNRNQAFQEQAIDLTNIILILMNQAQQSQENAFVVIEKILNFKALEYLKKCISEPDHSQQFIQNCIQVVLELAIHQFYFPYVSTFCQSAIYNVDCVIELISIINVQKVGQIENLLRSQQARYRVQFRTNIQNLISNMNLQESNNVQQVFPYDNIDRRSKIYEIMSKDKFIKEGTKKFKIMKHLNQ